MSKLGSSFSHYARNLLWIQSEGVGNVLFKLNEVQEGLEGICREIEGRGELLRLVILKSRRKGVSTWVSGRFFWQTVMRKGVSSYLVTQVGEATATIFRMQKRFLDNLRPVREGGVTYRVPRATKNNSRMLEFLELDSRISVSQAGSSTSSRGSSIRYAHLSEVAHWPEGSSVEVLTSVLNCVPDVRDTMVVFESTANGVGGAFHSKWLSCRRYYEMYVSGGEVKWRSFENEGVSESNQYTGIFIPWYVFRSYRREVPVWFERTVEEEELVDRYGLDDEQLSWRRYMLSNKIMDNPSLGLSKEQIFQQEYPSNAEEAFTSTGTSVFDVKLLMSLSESMVGGGSRYELEGGTFVSKSGGSLEVWGEPKRGEEYIISCDVSEGLHRGDWTSIDVIRWVSGEQVCHVHFKRSPDVVGEYLYYLGLRYNTALVVVESNNHGLSTLIQLLRTGYPSNRTYGEITQTPPHGRTHRYGFTMTSVSKPLIVNHLVRLLREGTLGVSNRSTLEEMIYFKVNSKSNKLGASEGKHDDRVISYGIAQWVRSLLPLPGVWSSRQSSDIGFRERREVSQGVSNYV